MSEPVCATGSVRDVTCPECGEPALQREVGGVYSGRTRWMTQGHNAPCGLPCMRGGARGREGRRAFRAGQMHGLHNRPCPACSKLAPVALGPVYGGEE